ncbi:MAG TPA: kelch repeat-containing protein [Tepidisphaeraceae bacterium]
MYYSAFEAHVSFQPANVPVPAGYVADTGALYGDQGNGFTYGWSGAKLPAVTRAQHAAKPARNGPDARYDSFALLNPVGRASQWQIAVPDGDYTVHLVTGSPIVFPARYRVNVEGNLVLDGRATMNSQWVEATATVTVTDGTLTLTAPRGTIDRLDYIDITALIGTAVPPAPPPTVPPSPPSPPAPPPPPTVNLTTPLIWQTLPNAPIALAEAQSVVADGRLYVFGGYNITNPAYEPTTASEVFDPATNTWTSLAPMPVGETHMGVATDGTSIYVAGGYTLAPGTIYQIFATANVFRYDIATNTWSTYVSLPAARGAGAMVYLDGQLHFMDGVDVNRNGQTEHWVLNPSDANPTWVNSTSVPETANHTAAVILNGDIVIVGGQSTDDDSSTITKVWEFDPTTNQWSALANMPIPRSHAMVDVIDNHIVVAGGTTANDVPLASVVIYDPTTNTWSTQTNLPDGGRLAPVGGVIDNEIILATGFGDGNLQAQTWAAFVT